MEKEWYKSRTLWVNALLILGGVFTAIAGEIQAGGAMSVFGLINVVLRVVTKTALK